MTMVYKDQILLTQLHKQFHTPTLLK